jgi:predicted  nucleic acid-binding Zn-ribbon protein
MKYFAVLAALTLVLGGCVSAGKYKSAVEESQGLQAKVSAYESEIAALRASSAAKAKEAQDKIDALGKQLKEASDQLAALQRSQADLQKEQKDLKKMDDLLKSDNERLEKALADHKADFAKAAAKLKALAEEMGSLSEPAKAAK